MPSIRRAVAADDLDFILIAKTFFKESAYDLRFDRRIVYENFHNIINHPDYAIFVATEGGDLVGLLAAQKGSTLFSADSIAVEMGWYVSPEFRNAKVALQLMQAFEGWAREVGCKFASMCDMHDLQDLQPLYERKGYKLTEKSYVKEL